MIRTIAGMSAMAVAVACASASAEVLMFDIAMSGLEEVPPNASPGFGMASITADTDTREVSIMVTWGGLIGSPSACHLHGLAPAGSNAGVLFGLTFMGDHFMGSGTLSEANFAGFMQGLTYVNLHTNAFPGGEIRGQVIVPGPGAAGLLALAGAVRSRRRRS